MSTAPINFEAERAEADAREQAHLLEQALADPDDYGVPITGRDLLDLLLKPAIEVSLFLVAVCGLLGMVYAPAIAKWLGGA